MAKHSPDKRLVYLHFSSIFKGPNAQVRRPKKVFQLISQHKHSIKILTNEFTLEAIALVARQLLEERIFESTSRAKLHFPELFQTSEAQEADREASEAEAARTEAEAVQDVVSMNGEEEGIECAVENMPHEQPMTVVDKTEGFDEHTENNSMHQW